MGITRKLGSTYPEASGGMYVVMRPAQDEWKGLVVVSCKSPGG